MVLDIQEGLEIEKLHLQQDAPVGGGGPAQRVHRQRRRGQRVQLHLLRPVDGTISVLVPSGLGTISALSGLQ